MKRETIKLAIISLIMFSGIMIYSMGWISLDSQECSYSKYNIYTNMTGGTRIFNHCIVPTNSVITRTEKCGTFGFVCRDVEPYMANSGGGVCFKLNNGNSC